MSKYFRVSEPTPQQEKKEQDEPLVLVSSAIPASASQQLDAPVSDVLPVKQTFVHRSLGQHRSGTKSNILKTSMIGVPTVYVGAAAGAITINTAVLMTPASFPELTQFGAVFDEIRIIAVHQEYTLLCATSATVPGVIYGSAAVIFDAQPNPTTSYAALESETNTGLMALWTSTASNQNPLTKAKVKITARPPKLTAIATGPPGSSWYPISELPNIFWNYGFFAAPSAAGVIEVISWQRVDVEFRMRL